MTDTSWKMAQLYNIQNMFAVNSGRSDLIRQLNRLSYIHRIIQPTASLQQLTGCPCSGQHLNPVLQQREREECFHHTSKPKSKIWSKWSSVLKVRQKAGKALILYTLVFPASGSSFRGRTPFYSRFIILHSPTHKLWTNNTKVMLTHLYRFLITV